MYELLSEIDIRAPIAAVWGILADFAAYAKWTGAAFVTEEPEDRTRISYAIRIVLDGGPEKPWSFPGRITSRHAPDILAWSLGMPWLLAIHMRYDLTRADGATHVRHLVRFGGLLPMLSQARFRRIWQPVMDRTLSDLAVRAGQPTRPSRLRRGGSAGKSRRRVGPPSR